MRQVSGHGSDNDTTDGTLRKGGSTARQRSGDDDRMLLGLFLMQRALPASLVTNRSGSRMADVRDFR